MKVIIIEGPDNTGKNTLIQNILDNNKIVKLIHCDKPEDEVDPFEEQCRLFYTHAYYAAQDFKNNQIPYSGINVIVFNRFYQGEYVYGQMYRNGNPDKIKQMVKICEDYLINNIGYDNIYYVQLLSTSSKLLKKNDDGKSLSGADVEKMNKEIELFTDIYNFSQLKKHIIYVNDGDEFRTREDILIEFNDFINTGI